MNARQQCDCDWCVVSAKVTFILRMSSSGDRKLVAIQTNKCLWSIYRIIFSFITLKNFPKWIKCSFGQSICFATVTVREREWATVNGFILIALTTESEHFAKRKCPTRPTRLQKCCSAIIAMTVKWFN